MDRVIRYSEPPLGERAYVADRAQATYVHSTRGGSTLSEVVRGFAQSDDLSWDSYYKDGQWVVAATLNNTQALWNFEPAGNTVHPINDAARSWMGVSRRDTNIDSSSIGDTVILDTPGKPVEPVRLVAVPELEPEITPEVAEATDTVSVSENPQVSVVIEEAELPLNVEPAEKTSGKKSKRGRAKVPSWDEILFGGPKNSS